MYWKVSYPDQPDSRTVVDRYRILGSAYDHFFIEHGELWRGPA